MALRTFTLPDLGEGLHEAEIVEWFVAEGDRVVADQPLLAVETDKAVVEAPSPWTGVVLKHRAKVGEVLKIGAPLADIEDEKAAGADKGAIVGELASPPSPTSPPATSAEAAARPSGVRATPAIRAHAQSLGVDLTAVAGTGPGGAITRADVEEAAGAPQTEGGGARRSMARAMAHSRDTVAPATVTDVADITSWAGPEADVLTRLVAALVAGAAAEPALNRWYEADAPQPEGVCVAIAVDAPHGLITPVLRGAEKLSAQDVRAGLDRLIEDTRARRLAPADRHGATVTLSNFGPIGGRHASLVVTPPQVAILGAGRAYESVGWRGGAVARVVELPLSLTFDHRAVTGGEAARFLTAVKAHLEQEAP